MLLSNDEFIAQLKDLFASRQSNGSVFLSQKRYKYAQEPQDDGASTSTSKEYPCIVRATNGKVAPVKVKISTLVQPVDQPTFMAAYGALLKATFAPKMRKKIKRKREAKKGANAAGTSTTSASKSGAKRTVSSVGQTHIKSGLPKVTGAKRGAGHAKRQRQEKARRKAVNRMLDARRRRRAEPSRPVTSQA
ncbi:hypothetical protein EMMF5_006059 [Cystobasidiomycetes sp. EMM_F5]